MFYRTYLIHTTQYIHTSHAAHHTLHAARHTLHTAHSLLSAGDCTLLTVLSTLHIVRCTQHVATERHMLHALCGTLKNACHKLHVAHHTLHAALLGGATFRASPPARLLGEDREGDDVQLLKVTLVKSTVVLCGKQTRCLQGCSSNTVLHN